MYVINGDNNDVVDGIDDDDDDDDDDDIDDIDDIDDDASVSFIGSHSITAEVPDKLRSKSFLEFSNEDLDDGSVGLRQKMRQKMR